MITHDMVNRLSTSNEERHPRSSVPPLNAGLALLMEDGQVPLVDDTTLKLIRYADPKPYARIDAAATLS